MLMCVCVFSPKIAREIKKWHPPLRQRPVSDLSISTPIEPNYYFLMGHCHEWAVYFIEKDIFFFVRRKPKNENEACKMIVGGIFFFCTVFFSTPPPHVQRAILGKQKTKF